MRLDVYLLLSEPFLPQYIVRVSCEGLDVLYVGLFETSLLAYAIKSTNVTTAGSHVTLARYHILQIREPINYFVNYFCDMSISSPTYL